MTSPIFERCNRVSHEIYSRFFSSGTLVHEKQNPILGVNDAVFTSPRYRRAHLSVVDARETHNLWLLHTTVFPHVEDNSPIYGFDLIAGPKKVSGAFHDFSSAGNKNHFMADWFSNRTANIDWNKKRELPEWAQKIFSNSMVAIGAVGEEELDKFIDLGLDTLTYYLSNVGNTFNSETNYADYQNYYCVNQIQNPHTPRVLVNLGFTDQEAQTFVRETLFPFIDCK